AITLAPRSCPSSPGLAITTLSFRIRVADGTGDWIWLTSGMLVVPRSPSPSDDRNFLVLAPHLAERVACLADCGVRADSVEDWRHQVLCRLRRLTQTIERAPDGVVVARPAQRLELHQLLVRGRLVDVENLDRRLVGLDEVVDADDHLVLPL